MCGDPSDSYQTIKNEKMSKLLDERVQISEKQFKTFYDKYIDYFKWTTTIALAALLWEGINHQYFNNTLFFEISLESFFLAVLSSIVFIIKILKFVYDDLKLNLKHIDSLKSTLFKDTDDRTLFEKQQWVDQKLSGKELKQIAIIKWIFVLVIIHTIFLIAGLAFFLLGIWPKI